MGRLMFTLTLITKGGRAHGVHNISKYNMHYIYIFNTFLLGLFSIVYLFLRLQSLVKSLSLLRYK